MSTYALTGMNCGACVAKIQKALADTPGVSVSLTPPRLEAPESLSLEEINKKISAAGNYAAIPLKTGCPITAWFKTYKPLLLIVGFISVASFKGAEDIHGWMLHFMAGFFLVFSFFKFLDLKGFADAYAGYDLLAARWRPYGFIYPFIELAFGLAFLFQINLNLTLVATILLMGFSSIGVIRAVLNKQKIRCACLGTALNLPMSTVTIVEDLGMVAMSAFMLLSA